jgi:hypothetical protein
LHGHKFLVQRLRVLVNGRNMEAQRTANQEPLVKFGNVPDGRHLAKQPFADGKEVNNRSLIVPTKWQFAIRLLCRGADFGERSLKSTHLLKIKERLSLVLGA